MFFLGLCYHLLSPSGFTISDPWSGSQQTRLKTLIRRMELKPFWIRTRIFTPHEAVLLVTLLAIIIKQSKLTRFAVLSLVKLFAEPERKPNGLDWGLPQNESFEKYIFCLVAPIRVCYCIYASSLIKNIYSKIVCNCRKNLTQLWS